MCVIYIWWNLNTPLDPCPNLKASSKREIIDWPPHYIPWFKFRFPAIRIDPDLDDRYVMEIFHGKQETKPVGRQWNAIPHLILSYLGFVKYVIDQYISII